MIYKVFGFSIFSAVLASITLAAVVYSADMTIYLEQNTPMNTGISWVVTMLCLVTYAVAACPLWGYALNKFGP